MITADTVTYDAVFKKVGALPALEKAKLVFSTQVVSELARVGSFGAPASADAAFEEARKATRLEDRFELQGDAGWNTFVGDLREKLTSQGPDCASQAAKSAFADVARKLELTPDDLRELTNGMLLRLGYAYAYQEAGSFPRVVRVRSPQEELADEIALLERQGVPSADIEAAVGRLGAKGAPQQLTAPAASAASSTAPVAVSSSPVEAARRLPWQDRVQRAEAVLGGLIGLEIVGAQIEKWVQRVEYLRDDAADALRSRGLEVPENLEAMSMGQLYRYCEAQCASLAPEDRFVLEKPLLHLVLSGPVGVGKKTSMPRLAEALYLLGLVERPSLEYVATHELRKVADVREKAGVIAIKNFHDIAKLPEASAQLSSLAEHLRDARETGDCAFIFSGSPMKLDGVEKLNDDFASNVNRLELRSLTNAELLNLLMKKQTPRAPGALFAEDAKVKLRAVLNQIPRRPDFANVSTVEKLFGLWRERAHDRIAREKTEGKAHSADERRTVTAADIDLPDEYRSPGPAGPPRTVAQICEALNQRVKGQAEAVEEVARRAAMASMTLLPRTTAVGFHLFAGESAVGKTFLAKELARELYNGAILEYSGAELINEELIKARLLGAEQGYLGSDKGGALINFVRVHRSGVLLIDEVERGNLPAIFNLLMEIKDKGGVTDADGNWVDCTGLHIILSTNIPINEKYLKEAGLSKTDFSELLPAAQRQANMAKLASRVFEAPWLGRLDSMTAFNPATSVLLSELAQLKFETVVAEQVAAYGRSVRLTESAKQALVKKYYDGETGTRALVKGFEGEVLQPLLEKLAADAYPAGAQLEVDTLDAANPSLVFRVV